MGQIKGNQHKYTVCSDSCGLLLIAPLHDCFVHTEPTKNSNLENPPRQPPSLLPIGQGECPVRMGWMARQNSTVLEPFHPGPSARFVWLLHTSVR